MNENLTNDVLNKVLFKPGDIVTLRQDLPNKPKMLVTEVVTSRMKTYKTLIGIKCIWFTTQGRLQELVFSTKDLIKL